MVVSFMLTAVSALGRRRGYMRVAPCRYTWSAERL